MLTARDLEYEINAHEVFSDVSFSVSEGDKIGLIGPNGAGKTTLLRIMAGDIEPTEGEVIREDVEVGLLPQDLRNWLDAKVYDFIEEVTGVKAVKDEFDLAETAYQKKPDDKTLVLFVDAAEKLGHFGVDEFEGRLAKSLNKAGLGMDFADREIGELSGGQRTRVALAAIMVSRYDVILLDEPTNNLDMEGIVILEKFIKGSNAAFLMVSHDRRFLRNATSRIIELLGGDQGVNQYGLGYDEYVDARLRAYESELKRFDEHKVAVKALESSVREKKVRANSAEKGAAKRSDNDKLGAKGRAGRAQGHLAGQARALESRLERLKDEAPHKPQEPVSLDFMFEEAEVAKQTLLRVNGLEVQYEEGGERYGPYDLELKGGDKVAITGANGTGKSTLVRAVMGAVDYEKGQVYRSPMARVGYIDQNQTLPNPEGTPLQNLIELAPGIPIEKAMHLLVKFNLVRENIDAMKASDLSGGERAKVLLAAVAANKANVLILDEPTNNLDIPTIEGLQEALRTYKGAVLLVSHDRDFIDGIGINRTMNLL